MGRGGPDRAGTGVADPGAREASDEAAAVVAEPRGLQVTATEVVAYLGSIVVLVGIGFLYGTQYQQLGSFGRDLILGLVALAALGCGFFMERRSDRPAARRARSAGFFVGISAVFFLATQVLVDGRVLTKLHDYGGGYTSDDTSGDIMAGAAAAFLLAAGLLWRTRAALVALAFAALAYTAMGAFEAGGTPPTTFAGQGGYLLVGAVLLGSAEVLVGRSTRGWTPGDPALFRSQRNDRRGPGSFRSGRRSRDSRGPDRARGVGACRPAEEHRARHQRRAGPLLRGRGDRVSALRPDSGLPGGADRQRPRAACHRRRDGAGATPTSRPHRRRPARQRSRRSRRAAREAAPPGAPSCRACPS